MDVLSLLKFWKTTSKLPAISTSTDADADDETISNTSTFSDPPPSDYYSDDDDDDDSFFELQLTFPEDPSHSHSHSHSQSSPSVPQNALHSDPILTSKKSKSKPQSPISVLRSAAASPKLHVFMFTNLRKKYTQNDRVFDSDSLSSPRKSNSSSSNDFEVKFRIEDGSIVPKFTRTDSSNLFTSPKRTASEDSSSKRFDSVQKYLGKIKKLPNLKPSKKVERFAVSPARSTASVSSVQSPRKEEKQSSRFVNFKKCRNLGKSKSASAMVVTPSPASFPARNEHASDGIEGAILHCKRSLNSSTGKSSLSRCSSDQSQKKSIQVCQLSEQI